MLGWVSWLFKNSELRSRIFFTIWCLIIYRIGSHITVPGVNPVALKEMISGLSGKPIGSVLAYIDMFAGGAFERFTIFALGVMPYITASIVVQLLSVSVPWLDQLRKEGEVGRMKIQQYIRYMTVFVALFQSFAISRWVAKMDGVMSEELGGNQLHFSLLASISITCGTVFLVWLGERITEKGIGNGVSLIIFSGIAARIPHEFLRNWQKIQSGEVNPVGFVLIMTVFFVIVFFVVYEQEAQRRIPVQYARRVIGRKVYGGQSTYLPFKLNPTGVIPIIFASAVVLLPAQLAQMLGESFPSFSAIAVAFSPGRVPYMFVYGFLVILFSYVYTTIQFDPLEISEALKKQGGYIPGVRPGQNTQMYLGKILFYISSGGAVFLALIAILPDLLLRVGLFSGVTPGLVYLMGGTSLLILVSVDLETMKQVSNQVVGSRYENSQYRG